MPPDFGFRLQAVIITGEMKAKAGPSGSDSAVALVGGHQPRRYRFRSDLLEVRQILERTGRLPDQTAK